MLQSPSFPTRASPSRFQVLYPHIQALSKHPNQFRRQGSPSSARSRGALRGNKCLLPLCKLCGQPILGASEFGSAIFGLRAFRGATRSIVLMPAKRGVATEDRNQVAAHLVGLAFGRTTAHLSLIIPPSRAFWQLNGLLNGKTCKPRNLRKEWDKDKLTSVRFARLLSGQTLWRTHSKERMRSSSES